jgi:hypothetical protein
VASGTRLTTDLVNGIINRTEYAADLLRQYKLVAGNGMYVEPHYDGTRVSYFYPTSGGATPKGSDIMIPAQETIVKENVEYSFPEGSQPIDRNRRLVFPDYVKANLNQYAIRISGGYWALLDSTPDPLGRYQAISAPVSGTTINFSSSFPAPTLGPHPPGINEFTGEPNNFWFGGSMTLIRR